MAFERFKKFNVDDLIAKNPADPRDTSRLMVLNRAEQTITHKHFYDLPEFLNAGDLLILNNSKVFPAKIYGKKETGGLVEVLLVRPTENNCWAVLLREYKQNMRIIFEEGLEARVLEKQENGEVILQFNQADILPFTHKYGKMPLPPYIEAARKHAGLSKSLETDKEKYQTVYAKTEGSIAAPTAGFHFTQRVFDALKQKGVKIAYVTLHVGWGTFKPLRGEPKDHTMLAELAELPPETAKLINETKQNKTGRVITVGTTSTRTIESFADGNGGVTAGKKWADLFIYGDYKFKVIDGLITNFHFPDSTPLCMVCALAGEDFIYRAYSQAVEQKYRFYSFGDSMAIL